MVWLEITRLVLGLLIAFFHQPLADFIGEQDAQLVALFRRRGVAVPDTLRREIAHNIFFIVGIAVAMVELVRIYNLIHR